MATTVRVWDLPTRIFHWALACCVVGLVGTAWAPTILFYLLKKRQDLVRPMVRGDKEAAAGTASSADGFAQRVLALVLFAGCVTGVWWMVR